MKDRYNIIPEKYLVQTVRRIEQVDTGTSRTVVNYAEKRLLDTKQMHKIKDQSMMLLLLEILPEGPKRDILIGILNCDTRGILAIGNKQTTVVKHIAKANNISDRAVQKALKFFKERNFIVMLNYKEYMVNPYVVLRNDIGTKQIEELQLFWDEIMDGIKHTTPIAWADKTNFDKDLQASLRVVSDNIDLRVEEDRQDKLLCKQHLAEDIATIDANTEQFSLLAIKFFLKHDYDVLKPQTTSIAHLARFIRKGQKESWPEFDDLPTLHLDRTIKPIRHLFNKD